MSKENSSSTKNEKENKNKEKEEVEEEVCSKKGLFRNTADYRTVFILGFTWVVFCFNWFFVYNIANMTLFYIFCPLVTVAMCLLFFCCAVANHNCVHTPVFYKKSLNSLVNIVLTLSFGHPSSSYVPGHNLSHHKHTQTRKDFMRTSKVNFNWNFLNGLLFFFWITGDVFRNDVGYFLVQRKLNRPIYRQVRLELFAMVIFNAFWILNGGVFKYFVLLYIPQFWAKWAITTINLLQHDGCEMTSKTGSGKYNSARNFTGSFLNWWCLNNGYHLIHHLHPAMHWSILKEKHEELIKPHNHPNLDQKSMLGYIFETYFYPGKRINYDGSEYKALNEGPDEPWFYEERETHSDVDFGDKYL